jgi:hypothetical protein
MKMVIEGHKFGQYKGLQQKIKAEMDRELIEIRTRMEQLILKM